MSAPGDFLQGFIDARSDPDVAMEGAHRRGTVGQDVQGRGEHRRLPRILLRQPDAVQDVGRVLRRRKLADGRHVGVPLTALADLGFGRGPSFRLGGEGRSVGDLDFSLTGGHAPHRVAIDGIGPARPPDADPCGVRRSAERDGHAFGRGRGDMAYDQPGLVVLKGRRALRDPVTGRRGEDEGAVTILGLEGTDLERRGRQRGVTRSDGKRRGVLSDRITRDFSCDEVMGTHGRRILATGHQVHLRGELAGPSAKHTPETQVVRDGGGTAFTQPDGDALVGRGLDRTIGAPPHPDRTHDPAPRRLDQRLRCRLARRLLGLGAKETRRKEEE